MSAEDVIDEQLEQRLRDHFAGHYADVRDPATLWAALSPQLEQAQDEPAASAFSRNGTRPLEPKSADDRSWLPAARQTQPLRPVPVLARPPRPLRMLASLLFAGILLLVGAVGLSYVLNRQARLNNPSPTSVTLVGPGTAQPQTPAPSSTAPQSDRPGRVVLALDPADWVAAHRVNYESGVDASTTYNGHSSAFMKATTDATLNGSYLAKLWVTSDYSGKRLRFSAYVKGEGVTEPGGLFFQPFDDKLQAQYYEARDNEAILGTTGWQKRQIVVDVPADSTSLWFGIYLPARGELWIADPVIEVVGDDVPLTTPTGLYNPGFEYGLSGYFAETGKDYTVGTDQSVYHSGKASEYIKSTVPSPDPAHLSSLGQYLPARPFAGKRLRISGYMKTDSVTGGALLWTRLEELRGGKQLPILALDNGPTTHVRGTTDWTSYSMVVQVPADISPESHIAIGLALYGAGQAWVDDFSIEEVGDDVPITALILLDRPTNTGFEQGESSWWFIYSSDECQGGTDSTTAHSGIQAGHLNCRVTPTYWQNRVSAAQMVAAGQYSGKRIRLSAYIKTRDVEKGAALTASVPTVDGSNSITLATPKEATIGTTDWTRYELVLDMPQNSYWLSYEVGLFGKGEVWFDDVQIEVLGDAGATTPLPSPSAIQSPQPSGGHNLGVAIDPTAWTLVQGKSAYETGADPGPDPKTNYYGPTVYLKPSGSGPLTGARLSRLVTGSGYSGKRLRYTVHVRAQDVNPPALLYFQTFADESDVPYLFASTNEPIGGTTGWVEHQIVMDAPPGPATLEFGLYMPGGGEVWVAGGEIEIVGNDVPLTVMSNLYNAGFEEGTGGWMGFGSNSGADVDTQVYRSGRASARLSDGFIKQYFPARQFAGKRLRLSGYVKTRDVKGGAALFMRLEETANGIAGRVLAMGNVPTGIVYGTTDWTWHSMVVDVPPDISPSAHIAFGFASKDGTAWVDDMLVEQVGTNIPATVRVTLDQLTNGDFEQGGVGWYLSAGPACSITTGPGEAHGGTHAAHLKCTSGDSEVGDRARLVQTIKVDQYRGQRVRVSVYIKTKDVSSDHGARLTAGVEAAGLHWPVNLHTTEANGTTDWTAYDLVFDVPQEGINLEYELELNGTGEAWFDDLQIQPVSNDTPLPTPVPQPSVEYGW